MLTGLLLKGIPALAMVMALLWVARHREANYYISYLVQLRDPDIATERELHTLGHGHLRADARRYGKDRAGTPGKKAIRALQTGPGAPGGRAQPGTARAELRRRRAAARPR